MGTRMATCVPEDGEGAERLHSQEGAAGGLYTVLALIYITLSKWLNSVTQFSHMFNGDNNNTYP